MADPRILTRYTDAFGTERSSPDWAIDHVRAVLAEDRAGSGAGFRDVVRVQAGASAGPVLAGRILLLEDGGEVRVDEDVPPDLPFGYHRLAGDEGPVLVLHAPPECPPAGAKPGWAIVAQLYAARSSDSWGHGDLRDARRLVGWLDRGGPGGHLMLNPLHAPIPGPDPQPSPYFPSSRVFRNPLYLCIDEVASEEPAAVDEWGTAARSLNADRLIDRSGAWAAKRAALAALWTEWRAEPATVARVDRYLADTVNRDYAAFCAAVEAADGARPAATVHELRHGGEPSEAERFWAWLQLLLDDQLHAVGGALIHDVAVGTDPDGADTWLWPDCFVLDGTRVGVPPDRFNTQGQDWGLPPFHPAGIRAAGYEPWVRAMRSSLAGAAGIRIDHIMGLERLFWIPEGGKPRDGVFVQYDLHELLDVVAIESHRADAFVVGEDLGTVPPTIAAAMVERGLLSYRVVALDSNHPSTYPDRTLAAITTHDLPTTIGLLSGSDLQDQLDLALEPNEDGTAEAAARIRAWAGGDAELSDEDVLLALHQVLADSPAHLVAATLEDLGLMAERPNMPGTTDAWPNWSRALPAPLEELLAGDVAQQVRATLADRVPS
ncbi:MAG: 4-alpha-glucanotransferase [Acidimicrobiales bacterium]